MSTTESYTVYNWGCDITGPNGVGEFGFNFTFDTRNFPGMTDEIALSILDGFLNANWPAGSSKNIAANKTVIDAVETTTFQGPTPPVFQ